MDHVLEDTRPAESLGLERADLYDPDVLDGTHWAIRIHHDGTHLQTSGSNGYPGNDQPTPSSQFKAFCKALSRLASGQPFA